MANSFITMQTIADMTLPLLMDNIAFMPLITLGKYDGAFKAKAGDTIQVKRPARVTAVDGTADISSAYIDFAETAVNITLDKIATVPRKWTSKEATLNMDDLQRLVVQPAVNALAEQVNLDLLGLYKDVYSFSGTSGTTPTDLPSITSARKILQDNRAPLGDRAFVMDTAAEASYLNLDNFSQVDQSGTNSALRDAALGRVMGMMLAADNQILTHTAGGYTALADVTITGGAAGATSIALTSAAGSSTATLLVGDIFSIDEYQFVVTATTAAASSGVIAAVSISPELPKAYGSFTSADVTFPDVTSRSHVANLMFQKEAFTLASAPLEGAIGGANSAFATAHGLTITVTQDYDIDTNTNLIRFDYLYGVQTTMPDLAVRVLG